VFIAKTKSGNTFYRPERAITSGMLSCQMPTAILKGASNIAVFSYGIKNVRISEKVVKAAKV